MASTSQLSNSSASAETAAPAMVKYTFSEPLRNDVGLIAILALLMVLFFGLTFGLQDLAKSWHSPVLQSIADFFFEGGLMSKAVWHGQIWRPVTVAFLHGGMFHLFGNVVNFALMAWFCSIAFARRSWLTIFFTSSILGSIVTILINPEQQLVGASVGIMGLYGALIAAEMRKMKIDSKLLPAKSLIPLKSLLGFLAMQLVVEHLIPNVGHTAHIAGLGIGLVLGFILPLNAGVRLLASRADLVKINSVVSHVDKRSKFVGRTIVDSISYTVDTLRAGDYLAIVQEEHGTARLTRMATGVLVGKVPDGAWLADCKLIASCYQVPSVEVLKGDVELDVAEEERKAAVPLWRRGLDMAVLTYVWHYLFVSWAPDMTLAKADLAWLHFLPSALAEPAISLGTVLGALIVSCFAAMMVSSILVSISVSFGSGFFAKPAKAK